MCAQILYIKIRKVNPTNKLEVRNYGRWRPTKWYPTRISFTTEVWGIYEIKCSEIVYISHRGLTRIKKREKFLTQLSIKLKLIEKNKCQKINFVCNKNKTLAELLI